MTTSLWPRERRAHSRHQPTAVIDHNRNIEWPIVALLVILLLALIFAGTIIFHYPIANAAEAPALDQVHTVKEVCQYEKIHPGNIINRAEVNKHCV